MKIRTLSMMLVLVVMAVFLIINWGELARVVTVNLVFREVQAPLGVIVVAAFAAVVLLLVIYTVCQQASVMMELRAASKDARRAHQAAEEADKNRLVEASRRINEHFDALDKLINARFDEIADRLSTRQVEVDAKFAEVLEAERALEAAIKSEMTAQIGALDRKVAETLPAPAEEKQETEKKKEIFGDLF